MSPIVSGPRLDDVMAEWTQPAGREDPYGRYDVLRREGPLARAADGAVVLTRYQDCYDVLHNPRCGHSDATEVFERIGLDWQQHLGLRMFSTSLLTMNPPQHTRLRRLVSGTFTARRVANLEPAIG